MTRANMEQTVTKENILDTVGVCQLLRIGRGEVYRLVHAGRLPVMRLGKKGRTLRFVRTDLLALRETLGRTR